MAESRSRTVDITPHWPGMLKYFRHIFYDHYHDWPSLIGITSDSRIFARSPGYGTVEWVAGAWSTSEADWEILEDEMFCYAWTVPATVHYMVDGKEVDLHGNPVGS